MVDELQILLAFYAMLALGMVIVVAAVIPCTRAVMCRFTRRCFRAVGIIIAIISVTMMLA